MAYLTSQLINRAYFLSGVVGRGFEELEANQLNDGLDMLNAIISFKTADQKLIPYFQEYDFTAVVGQEKYFVPDLVNAETFTYNIGSVRYACLPQTRKQYFGNYRVDNINSLLFQWHAERTLNGSNIYVYFFPSQAFALKIWGKFSLPDVTLLQDLSLTLDQYYIEYLKYALAEYICQEYNLTFSAQSQQKLNEFEKKLTSISPPDLTQQKISVYQPNYSLNYGIINLSGGWV
jgi:hypothetical protein